MKRVTIKNKSIPNKPRSENYPAGTAVAVGGGGATIVTPGGSDIDIIKTTDSKSATDKNVYSSLRTISEVRKHFVTEGDKDRELADTNAFSSLRSVKEIEERALSRLTDDTAAGNIGFEKNITVGKTSTTLNLIVRELAKTYDLEVDHVATLFRTIIKDYISSETFIPGMLGEGAKLYKTLTGDWNLELDNVTVRKAITTFEMVISKVRAVNGGLVVSAANGKVKSVATTTGDPAYYVLGIEGDMTFVVNDLVRCQVFTSGSTKYYWLPIEQINGDSILILKNGVPDGVAPAEGDELVQMGNRTDAGRQGVLYLTASEDGKPRFSVLDGINSPTLAGKNKVVLGCLDGITDTDFPADYQPSGYGLYAMNVFLKGLFILRNGKTVDSALSELSTQIEAIPGQISLKVTEEVGKMQLGGRNYYKKDSPVVVLYEQPQDISQNHPDCPNGMYLIGANGGNSAVRIVGVIDSNGYWTVSFDLRGSQSINHRAFTMDVCDGTSKEVFLTPDNNWHHHEYTFYVDRHDSAPDVYNFVDLEGMAWAAIYIRNLKIEKGNKATDWTPAPEDIEARMSQAELSLKPENIWLGIKNNVQEVAKGVICKDIDARGLDENTYYPLVIDVPIAPMATISINYSLEGIKPSWATHPAGFSVQVRWTTNGYGWGAMPVQRTIHEATQVFCSGNVVGSISQISNYSKEYIFVRGGGYYHVRVEGIDGDGSRINLYPNGASFGSDPYVNTIGTTNSVTFPIPAIAGILDTGIDITNRKIVATADKFVVQDNSGNQMAVFENGKIRADRIDAGQIVADGINTRRISTGNLEVTSGAKIAGFNISGSSLNSGTMNLSPDNITFNRSNIYAGIGIGTGPSELGLDIPIWIQNKSYSDTCIAAHLSATGAYNIFNNVALSLNGCISGHAIRVKQLNNSNNYYTIGSEGFVSCYNTSRINIYLPSSPCVGRAVTVKRVNNAHVEVYSNGFSIYANGVYSSVGLNNVGEVHRYVFDGQYWMRSWANG